MARLEDHETRMERALLSLDGLSVGDAFGQRFFVSGAEGLIAARAWPREPWMVTDDTMMAVSIVEVLSRRAAIDRDELAQRFAARYRAEPGRGYGGMAHQILTEILQGISWEQAAGEAFDGEGSMGNGGAMRSAPIGAFFADELDALVEQARRSAQVTHGHPEGQAGAIAVTLAAAEAARLGQRQALLSAGAGASLLEVALEHTPDGPTREGLERAVEIPLDAPALEAAQRLGNGSKVISQDTVPFSLWCAARHLDSFEEALWTTVSALGDRDTTCAIVGGVVALAVGRGEPGGIPARFLAAREPLCLDLE